MPRPTPHLDRARELAAELDAYAALGDADREAGVTAFDALSAAAMLHAHLAIAESCIEKRAEQSDEPVARFRMWTADRIEVIVQGTINGERCWRTYVGTVTTAGELIWRTDSVAYSPPVDWNDLPLPGWKVSES